MRWREALREPLLHFLALGGALFLWFEWSGGGAGPSSKRIVVSSGQIDHLAAAFAKTWQRPATEEELKHLLDEWVREEIAVREAMTMGLDRDDTVIRRRLRQKLEFVVEDVVSAAPPSDAELQEWLASHPEAFRVEPRIALRQVFLSRERRGAAAEADARALLARLAAAGAEARLDGLGDPSLLPAEVPLAARREIASIFGDDFATSVEAAPAGAWSGPFESAYGLHLVWVSERVEGALPALAEVRGAVERELVADLRARQLAAMYERLLDEYTVVFERSATAATTPGGS